MKNITRDEALKMLGAYKNTKTIKNNQTVVNFENGDLFESHGTLIGIRVKGQIYLTNYHDYSTTTSKYTREWCGLKTDERRKGLQNETIILIC